MIKHKRHPNGMPLLFSWFGRELNPRHADFQSAALPTELPNHIQLRIDGENREFGEICKKEIMDALNQAMKADDSGLCSHSASVCACVSLIDRIGSVFIS
jgi:hypothetical protein